MSSSISSLFSSLLLGCSLLGSSLLLGISNSLFSGPLFSDLTSFNPTNDFISNTQVYVPKISKLCNVIPTSKCFSKSRTSVLYLVVYTTKTTGIYIINFSLTLLKGSLKILSFLSCIFKLRPFFI